MRPRRCGQLHLVLTDGRTEEHVYIIGGASQGRPRRIFWTDWPYEAPAVNLAGKFVKFFGNPDILTLVMAS
jgi:hypothetical protein